MSPLRRIISTGTLSCGVFVSKLVSDAVHSVISLQCVFECTLRAWHGGEIGVPMNSGTPVFNSSLCTALPDLLQGASGLR